MTNQQLDDNFIVVSDLYKSFNGQQVLRGINLTIRKGESLVVIGKSGGGKSVFMKHIIGLLKPDSGSIHIENQEITALKGRKLDFVRKKCAYLFQSGALFDSMTVIENVMFPLAERTSYNQNTIREKSVNILCQVGLEGVYHKYPAELSGGMQKRVALARALVLEPDILLFDEPTTGLDPLIMSSILDLINETHERFKYTAIIISHEVPTIFKVANRVAMIHEGQIIAVGTPQEIVKSELTPVKNFIGEVVTYRASAVTANHQSLSTKGFDAISISG
ncbi:MAG TPA: ATP-binding cassette domain-containing protein [Thermodesulfovibrionia bacterium]|nr:ATP-binding cassette domain-containing protein [Thermodesulfovibrionia bacterium]